MIKTQIHKMLAMQTREYIDIDVLYEYIDIEYFDLFQILRVAMVEREVCRSDSLHELDSLC